MRKRLLPLSLTLLPILLAMPQAASAKADTSRITISGGGLTSAIEITDPRILGSSNVWVGDFLDGSRPSAKRPPAGLPTYEVSFYVKLAPDQTKKMYVVYYCPDAGSGPGYIYLPGKGDEGRYLNWGTIIRPGLDGKWNYASPAWEDLVKPVIARADAAQHHGS